MKIKVQKKNPADEVLVEYEGDILERNESSVILEALFTREDMPFMDVVFKKDDRFVEYYYADRWYNIFEIHDRDDGKIKGWYCNIGMPVVIEAGVVSYVVLLCGCCATLGAVYWLWNNGDRLLQGTNLLMQAL